MIRTGLFLVLVGVASGLSLRKATPDQFLDAGESESVAAKASAGPKIDVYVINMKTRPDRCQCMAKQLHSLPANVYLHEAASGNSCGIGNFEGGGRNFDAEQGIFCSNREVWERANRTNADFIVVLEDDVELRPGFFEKVQEMTKCAGWNYLNVDTFDLRTSANDDENYLHWHPEDSAGSREGAVTLCNEEVVMTHHGFGAHMQIIRKSFLPEMMKMADGGQQAMDWWLRRVNADQLGFRWQPGIVTQFRLSPESPDEDCVAASKNTNVGDGVNLDKHVNLERNNVGSGFLPFGLGLARMACSK